MIVPTRKEEVTQKERIKYKILEQHEAFVFELDKVIEERCDEFIYQLEDEGYTLVSEELEPVAVSIFNFKVIAYK